MTPHPPATHHQQSTTDNQIGALGGTFDHFHAGHEHFLRFAAKQVDQLIIGVTDQSLIKEKELAAIIQPFETRKKAVEEFCQREQISAQIVKLTDAFGPTLGQQPVDRLIVTEFTKEGGVLLNKRRVELGLGALSVDVCSMVKDETGKVLNSTRIRQGIVDRLGHVYDQAFLSDYIVQIEQKNSLKKPLGELVAKPQGSGTLVVVVGDVCLSNFRKNGWEYQLGVFDKRTKRQAITDQDLLSLTADVVTKNQAGMISVAAVGALKQLIFALSVMPNSSAKHLYVEGEEDLLTVALVLLLPLGSVVYYGQPDVGMVRVVVDERSKEVVSALFAQ